MRISRIMAATKYPISALPLPPRSHILTQNLTPDPLVPSATELRSVIAQNPSVQRRARLVRPETHFSHLTPLPLQFPYRIQALQDEGVTDKAGVVEQWLSSYEALDARPLVPTEAEGVLKKYTSDKREIKRELIGLSDTGLRDCLPHLDVGDAFSLIGIPALAKVETEPNGRTNGIAVTNGDIKNTSSQELVDVLSGHSVLMSHAEDGGLAYAPWSLRYSGHQFGVWAGQLGDGRAISILETPHPTVDGLQYELQLKGAGRTPYSRSADGLAVLRSSIREYLCAEAMHALNIPTTRSLALIHLPDLQVIREEIESACVLTRVAPSFIRIGSFEALNPPQNMFFFGGGQQDADLEALRILGEWVAKRVLKLDLKEGEPWGKELVMEVARRNAKMVAGWQAYGFMHGVINTDNVSILGLTIDYGPYAFMDIYDPNHICNHSDGEGRYAYRYQPTMIVYALRALLSALSPLIGAEEELGTAVQEGWAIDVGDAKLDEWKRHSMDLEDEVKSLVQVTMEKEYWALYRKRLGLKTEQPEDKDKIIDGLLNIMQSHKLDFHSTFRRLCAFRPSLIPTSESKSDPTTSASDADKATPYAEADTNAIADDDALTQFIASLCSATFETDISDAANSWVPWLHTYAARLQKEEEVTAWGGDWEKRESEMRKANPRFVLRQWVLEDIIKRVKEEGASGKKALAKLHEMATRPYEPWGAEYDNRPESELTDEEREERRVCGLGARTMLGFQCSCSS